MEVLQGMRGYIYITDNLQDLYERFTKRYELLVHLPETFKGKLAHAELYNRNSTSTILEIILKEPLSCLDLQQLTASTLQMKLLYNLDLVKATPTLIKISSHFLADCIGAGDALINMLTGVSVQQLPSGETYSCICRLYANYVTRKDIDSMDSTMTIYPLLAFRDIKSVITNGLVQLAKPLNKTNTAIVASVFYNVLKSNGLINLYLSHKPTKDELLYTQQSLYMHYGIIMDLGDIESSINVNL